MADSPAGALRIGFVVERSSPVTETAGGREILELERQGVETHTFRLDTPENWQQAPESGAGSVSASLGERDNGEFAGTWEEMRRRILERRGHPAGLRRALILALEHPSRGGRRYLAEALALADKAEKLGLHHLHAHSARTPAFVAMLASLISGAPYSFTAHAQDMSAAGPPAVLWRRQLRHARFAVTVAEANARHITRTLGRRAAMKMRLLYSGVDLEATRPSLERFRAPIPKILCVSRLVEKKGVDVLIDALDMIGRQERRFACSIVGEGAQEIELKRRVVKAGLEDRVEFTGSLSHQELIRRLRAADALVLPSRLATDGDRDALPVILLEAMAAGIPCVVTPAGGISEIVRDSETGLVVEPEDAGALGAALLRLLEDAELRRRLGDGGRRRAEQMFDLRRNVAVLRGWFAEAAGSQAAASEPEDPPVPKRSERPVAQAPLRDLRA